MAFLPCKCPVPLVRALDDDQCMAAADGDVSEVVAWLARGGDVNALNPWGNTLLSLACYNGHTHLVRELIRFPNLHVNIPNDEGETPLSIAAATGAWDIVMLLLSRDLRCRVDVSLKPEHSAMTPVMHCSAAGAWQVLGALLDHERRLTRDEAEFVVRTAGEGGAWAMVLTVLRKDYKFQPDQFPAVLEAAYEARVWDVVCAFLRQTFPDKVCCVCEWVSRAVGAAGWGGVQGLLKLLHPHAIVTKDVAVAAMESRLDHVKTLLDEIENPKNIMKGTLLVVSAGGCDEATAKYLLSQCEDEDDASTVLVTCLQLSAINNQLTLLPQLLLNHQGAFTYHHLSQAQKAAETKGFSNADRLLKKALELKSNNFFPDETDDNKESSDP